MRFGKTHLQISRPQTWSYAIKFCAIELELPANGITGAFKFFPSLKVSKNCLCFYFQWEKTVCDTKQFHKCNSEHNRAVGYISQFLKKNLKDHETVRKRIFVTLFCNFGDTVQSGKQDDLEYQTRYLKKYRLVQ